MMTAANPGKGSTSKGREQRDVFRVVDAFGRLREGKPTRGDLSALGIILVASGLGTLGGALLLEPARRMWLAVAIGGVLIVAGAAIIIYAVRMHERLIVHRWTRGGTCLALDGPSVPMMPETPPMVEITVEGGGRGEDAGKRSRDAGGSGSPGGDGGGGAGVERSRA